MSGKVQHIDPTAWAPPVLVDEYRRAAENAAESTYAAILKRLLHPKAEGVWRDFEAMVDKAAAAQRDMIAKLGARQGGAMAEHLQRLAPSIFESEATNLLGEIGQAIAEFEAASSSNETRAVRKGRLESMAKQLSLVADHIEQDHDACHFNGLLPYVASNAWPEHDGLAEIIGFLDQRQDNPAFAQAVDRLENTLLSDVMRRMASALVVESECDDGLVKSPAKGLRPHLTRSLKKLFRERYQADPDKSPPKSLVEFCQLAIYGWPSSGERGDLSDQEATNYVRATKS